MCGIAAIVSGVHIFRPYLQREIKETCHLKDQKENESVYETIDNLKSALRRRGPDNLGSKEVLIQLECGKLNKKNADSKTTCVQDVGIKGKKYFAHLDFIGAMLQLRGLSRVCQPLEDSYGNVLVYNGEIFGGIHVPDDSNDLEVLLHELEKCSYDCIGCNRNGAIDATNANSIPGVISAIKGPLAFIYWQENSKTIWFGRDAFGRRSLLVHWPTSTDSRFILSSVSSPSFVEKYSGLSSIEDGLNNKIPQEVKCSKHEDFYWEELPCEIYSIEFKISNDILHMTKEGLLGVVQTHRWLDPNLNKSISWDRLLVNPNIEHANPIQIVHSEPSQKVLDALRRSVKKRTKTNSIIQSVKEITSPVAVLFSGGLDSMILCALLDQCLNPHYIIDLLNVSFDGQFAPDRVSARLGLRELQKVAPMRRWRLVEIDAILLNLNKEIKHVTSLIHPADTYMDLNIGMALWLAAGGDGFVDGQMCNLLPENRHKYQYKSKAEVLLVGSGADEQCAGYGRHRTKYKHGGWYALHEEMRLDMQRIWKRNLGRDDRLISDHGKEARFPFLDEEVIQTLLEIPLWDIAKLDEPVGVGDKKILREVARLLYLEGAAAMPKRAIQFGTRIAQESNRKNFGSNRAANQASAGSIRICESI